MTVDATVVLCLTIFEWSTASAIDMAIDALLVVKGIGDLGLSGLVRIMATRAEKFIAVLCHAFRQDGLIEVADGLVSKRCTGMSKERSRKLFEGQSGPKIAFTSTASYHSFFATEMALGANRHLQRLRQMGWIDNRCVDFALGLILPSPGPLFVDMQLARAMATFATYSQLSRFHRLAKAVHGVNDRLMLLDMTV
jgi:hypothetical protein